MTVICLHGPESTGKSTIGPRLAAHLGGVFVPEYGRSYCETNGTDLTMADLIAIAGGQTALVDAARANRTPVVTDTDALMTAVWADMLLGRRDAWFDRWRDTADFYLLFDIDLPWVADGTRLFGRAEDRARFLALSRAELDRRALPYAVVRGTGEARWASVLSALATR